MAVANTICVDPKAASDTAGFDVDGFSGFRDDVQQGMMLKPTFSACEL